jgi:hypothetical protein
MLMSWLLTLNDVNGGGKYGFVLLLDNLDVDELVVDSK